MQNACRPHDHVINLSIGQQCDFRWQRVYILDSGEIIAVMQTKGTKTARYSTEFVYYTGLGMC